MSKHTLDDERDEDEYARLRSERHGYVAPTCCAASRLCKAIVLEGGGARGKKPSWSIVLRYDIGDYRYDPSIGQMAAPLYCPFCGAKLPEIVRKARPPSPIMRCTDGGYYCDTCEERLQSCTCWPPWSGWEERL